MMKLLATLTLFIFLLKIGMAHSHLDDGFEESHMVVSTCHGFQVWWKSFPYSIEGKPVSGQLYVTMHNEKVNRIINGKKTGVHVEESHDLNEDDAKFFSAIYKDAGSASIPIIASLTAGLIPGVGEAMSFLDWAIQNAPNAEKASEVGMLMESGGRIDRIFSIWEKQDNEPWITISNTYNVDVNQKEKRYLLCTWSYPLKVKQ